MKSLLCFSTAPFAFTPPLFLNFCTFLSYFSHAKKSLDIIITLAYFCFTGTNSMSLNGNIYMKLGSFRIMSASFHTPLKLFSHQKRNKSLSQLTHVMFYIYPLYKTLYLYSSVCFLMKLGSFRIFSALFASFRIFS